MKLTPWYPPEVKPVRKGVYEVREEVFGKWTVFAYWNGKRFGYRETESIRAYDKRDHPTGLSATAPWRGLAEEPK